MHVYTHFLESKEMLKYEKPTHGQTVQMNNKPDPGSKSGRVD